MFLQSRSRTTLILGLILGRLFPCMEMDHAYVHCGFLGVRQHLWLGRDAWNLNVNRQDELEGINVVQWRLLASTWFVYKCNKRLRLVYVNSELFYYSRTECEITRLPYLTDMDQNETWGICISVNATRSTRSLRATCHPRQLLWCPLRHLKWRTHI